MSAAKQIYEQVIRYLKGILSNRERHDLEKAMMRDSFDEEAFEGLNQLSAGELEADMAALMNKLDNRIQPAKRRNLVVFYRIAASILLLTGIGVALFFVLRTPERQVISENIKQDQQAAPSETKIPAVPAFADQESTAHASEKKGRKDAVEKSKADHMPEANHVEIVVEAEAMNILEEEKAEMAVPPVVSDQKEYAAAPQKTESEKPIVITISGRVLDRSGEVLPGVFITEKGTNRTTYTDQNGNFRLQVSNPDARLSLSTIGFTPLELNSRDVQGKDILLNEDLVALNEVVVVNKRSAARTRSETSDANLKDSDDSEQLQGKVSGIEVRGNTAVNDSTEWNTMVKPVPPGGSLKEYKKWVDSRVNDALFSKFPGRYRLTVTLTIHPDGTVSHVQIGNQIPEVIALEYKRVISGSALWKPAYENGSPVETEIGFRMVVVVDEMK